MAALRWGILGTARINRRLIPAIRRAARSELWAVASRTGARADAYAAQWQIPRAVAGYQSLLNDATIDAVYLPLPNSEHVPWTLAAIAAGKHVLCEKPMALCAADIDRIYAAASAAKVVVEEGYMYRHEPLTAKVLELVQGGATATIYAGFRAAYRTWLEVLGSDGALTVPNPFKPGLRETLALDRDGRIEAITVIGSPELFVREIEDFEAAVLDGAPPVVTLADSRHAAATLSALLDSARDARAMYPE